MEFKRAKLEDISLIRILANEIFHNTYKEIISPEQMEYMFEWMYSESSLVEQIEAGHIFYIAYMGDAACGFFSLELKDEAKHIYHLQKLYLLPKYHGHGKKLLAGVIDYINKESPKEAALRLNVNRHNHRAIRFYEKNGLIKLRAVDVKISDDFYMNDYIMGIDFESLF